MNKFRFLAPIGFLAVVAGFSAVVMLLWNWLIPSIFGLGAVSFWQALGLLIICRILFGNVGGWHRRMHGGHGGGMHGKHHLREKWMKMTPEERKEFINKRKEYFEKGREHFARGDFFGRPHFDPFADGDNVPQDHE